MQASSLVSDFARLLFVTAGSTLITKSKRISAFIWELSIFNGVESHKMTTCVGNRVCLVLCWLQYYVLRLHSVVLGKVCMF